MVKTCESLFGSDLLIVFDAKQCGSHCMDEIDSKTIVPGSLR